MTDKSEMPIPLMTDPRKIQADIEAKRLNPPHKSQLSRARMKLDLLLCLQRRKRWMQMNQPGQRRSFIYVSCDASPIGGKEFFIALEDQARSPG